MQCIGVYTTDLSLLAPYFPVCLSLYLQASHYFVIFLLVVSLSVPSPIFLDLSLVVPSILHLFSPPSFPSDYTLSHSHFHLICNFLSFFSSYLPTSPPCHPVSSSLSFCTVFHLLSTHEYTVFIPPFSLPLNYTCLFSLPVTLFSSFSHFLPASPSLSSSLADLPHFH